MQARKHLTEVNHQSNQSYAFALNKLHFTAPKSRISHEQILIDHGSRKYPLPPSGNKTSLRVATTKIIGRYGLDLARIFAWKFWFSNADQTCCLERGERCLLYNRCIWRALRIIKLYLSLVETRIRDDESLLTMLEILFVKQLGSSDVSSWSNFWLLYRTS